MLCLGPLARAFVRRLYRGRSLQKHRGLLERAEHWIHFSESILELLDALGTCQHHLLFIVEQEKGGKERRGRERPTMPVGVLSYTHSTSNECRALSPRVSQTNSIHSNRDVTVQSAKRERATPYRFHNSPGSDQTSQHFKNTVKPAVSCHSPMTRTTYSNTPPSKACAYLPRYKDEEADLWFCQAVNQPGKQLRFVVAEATVCRGNKTFEANRKA